MQTHHKMQQTNFDKLNLGQQQNIMNQLTDKQQIKYSIMIKKINEDRILQQRIFLLTNEAVYNIAKKSSLIKSLVSRLINIQNKYEIKRKIPYKQLYGITLSKAKGNGQFIIHVIDDYDYRYCAQNYQQKINILKRLCQTYTSTTGKKLAFYFKDDIVLLDYSTRKVDIKNRVSKKPKDDPIYLTIHDFQEYQLPDLNYQLQYSRDSNFTNLTMKNFRPIFEVEKLQNSTKYYSISNCEFTWQKVKSILSLFNSRQFLMPEFVFSTKNKLTLIRPFLIGGNLSRKLQTSVRISNELAYFYIAQLVLMLEEFEQKQIFYGNFCLENIYINENGYLRIMGIDKTLMKISNNEKIYDIKCYLPYIAPEMILCKGYCSKDTNRWKLGICAYKLLYGNFPFEGPSTKQMYWEIFSKKLKSETPSFLLSLLERQPEKRLSLEELKKQQKFSKINWKLLRQQTFPAPYIPDISSWKGNLPSIVQLKS